MKRISIAFIVFGLAFLTSCKLQKEGLVIMTDDSYKASVFATNRTGFIVIRFNSRSAVRSSSLHATARSGVPLSIASDAFFRASAIGCASF